MTPVVVGNRRRGGGWWRLALVLTAWLAIALPTVATLVVITTVRAWARALPPVPDVGAWQADAPATSRIVARDLQLGVLDAATVTPAAIARVLEHYATAAPDAIRGARRWAHQDFVTRLSAAERAALADEAVAWVRTNGFWDPDGRTAAGLAPPPSAPPRVTAPWPGDGKRYRVLLNARYGELVWADFDRGGADWVRVRDLDPPGTPEPTPAETCQFAVGDKVKAPWSKARDRRWPGKVVEVYAGMARLAFNDGDRGWARCAGEIIR